MFGIGIQELVLVLVIVLVLFGGNKLPQLSRNIGEALRELRRGFTGDETITSPKSKKTKETK